MYNTIDNTIHNLYNTVDNIYDIIYNIVKTIFGAGIGQGWVGSIPAGLQPLHRLRVRRHPILQQGGHPHDAVDRRRQGPMWVPPRRRVLCNHPPVLGTLAQDSLRDPEEGGEEFSGAQTHPPTAPPGGQPTTHSLT